MVTAEDRICLLDFGLVGRLTANMQRNLVQFAVAVASRDAETTARLIYRIGRPMERVALPELRDHVADLMGRYMVQRIDEIDAASLVNDLMDTAMAYRIRLPPAYALLAKAAVTVEGIARSLWPSLDITQAVLPYATKVLAERYNPQAVMKMALRSAVQVMDGVQEMPLLASQLVNDLQEGRMSVQITNDGLAELSASLRALGTKVFLGLVTAGCITGSFFVLAQYPWEYEGVNLWALLGLLLSGGLASAVLTWHIIGRRFGKLKLRTLFRLFRRR
jgi:ubiquinone biosynthesis protein